MVYKGPSPPDSFVYFFFPSASFLALAPQNITTSQHLQHHTHTHTRNVFNILSSLCVPGRPSDSTCISASPMDRSCSGRQACPSGSLQGRSCSGRQTCSSGSLHGRTFLHLVKPPEVRHSPRYSSCVSPSISNAIHGFVLRLL